MRGGRLVGDHKDPFLGGSCSFAFTRVPGRDVVRKKLLDSVTLLSYTFGTLHNRA